MIVNLNKVIKVKLTDRGRIILSLYEKEMTERLRKYYHDNTFEYKIPNLDNNELTCEFWKFMEIFGGKLHVGSEPVTEDNCIEV